MPAVGNPGNVNEEDYIFFFCLYSFQMKNLFSKFTCFVLKVSLNPSKHFILKSFI